MLISVQKLQVVTRRTLMDPNDVMSLIPHQHEGTVYYDSRIKRFFQKRRIKNDDVFICSRFHPYYEGAILTCNTQPLSPEYIKACVEVTAIDKLDGAFFDGFGWRVRPESG